MPNDWAARPSIRARDIDREYAMGLLRDASVDGQLTSEEFDQRLRQAMHAKTLGDLAGLVEDLQGQAVPPPVAQPLAVPPRVYEPVARVHARRRSGRGAMTGVLALAGGLGLVLLLLSGGFSVTGSGYDAYTIEGDGVCADDGVCEVVDNPPSLSGTSASAVGHLKDLGLPADLPIPQGARFTGNNWLSADNTTTGEETTYRWHLEYAVEDVDGEPVFTDQVADFYRATVNQETFGWDTEEEDMGDGVLQIRWASEGEEPKTGDYTLVVRAHAGELDGVRVELDVTTAGPLLSRPDVTGELGKALQQQKIATTTGMTYVRSRVSQLASDPSSCQLEQEWTGANGGKNHVFTATESRCEALAF